MCSANMFFGTKLSGFFAALLMCKRGKMQSISSLAITRLRERYLVVPSSPMMLLAVMQRDIPGCLCVPLLEETPVPGFGEQDQIQT